ncbi:MAG: hypothetical protein JO250_04970 [Armatimonadetes bacterium]|nr:hypothetical protein [Armatimonadota bacterium]
MDWVFLALALAVTGFVWARAAQARREEARQAEERAGYRRRIAQDPKNAGAHEALGDSLRAAGQWQEAHEAYLGALEVSGEEAMTTRVEYKLRQLDLGARERAAHQSPQSQKPPPDLCFCRQCGGANSPTRRVCETCGAAFPHDTFREALRDKEVLRASAETTACVLVLCAALWVASAQPLEVKGILIMAAIIVVAWRFLQAIGSPRV